MDSVGFVTGLTTKFSARTAANTPSTRCARTVPQMGQKSLQNREAREAIVAEVQTLLDESMLAFSVPLAGYTVKEISVLRESMPSKTKVKAVKNTLFCRAVEDTTWKVAGDLCKGSNLWFFVQEDMKATVETLNKFNKTQKKDETHSVLGGVMEGTLYDSKGVDMLSKLPSKKDLYQMMAVAINMVPTKLGRGIKAVPTKLARAIKLAKAEE